jgi:tetratricopeptide (TPR) repeat protein
LRRDAISPPVSHTIAVPSLRDVPGADEVAERKEFYQRSLDLFLVMIANDPVNVPAWGHCGLLLYELGRFDESLAYFRKIIDHEPGNIVAWDAQGFIMMERADFAGAAGAFEKVLELSPKRTDVATDMALCLFHTGSYDRAGKALTDSVGKMMGTKEHFLMGRIAEKTAGNPAPHFERALDAYRIPGGPVRQGVFATLAAMRGVIFTRTDRIDQAREALIEAGERASLTDPDRMILSAVDLVFRVRGTFIREIKGLLEGLPQ